MVRLVERRRAWSDCDGDVERRFSKDALLTNVNNEGTGISSGAFQGGHGADCGAPPATHTISALPDTLYICNGHLMTAESDTSTYLTPAALADWSAAAASVSFKVSTFRFSARDWWELWLTPFGENLVAPETPVSGSPFFNGPPRDALHIVQGITTGCSLGQPSFGTSNGSREGTFFHYEVYGGGVQTTSGGRSNPCMEDVAGGVSAAVRSQFTLTVSAGHVRFGMAGPSASATWIDDAVSLPFSQAVVQLAHRSYNPSKACGFDGTCGPNTFHWSDFAMTGSAPISSFNAGAEPGDCVSANTSCWFALRRRTRGRLRASRCAGGDGRGRFLCTHVGKPGGGPGEGFVSCGF